MTELAVTTKAKKEDGLLKRIGKSIARGVGDTIGYVGGMAALAGAIAFVAVYAVPAFFGLVGTIADGGSLLALGARMLEPLPYFAAWIGGGVAAALGGFLVAELAGGSRWTKPTEEESKATKSTPSQDIPAPEKPSADLGKTAAPSFNGASPRSSIDATPAILAAAAVATMNHSFGGNPS